MILEEEEIKNMVAAEFFGKFDDTKSVGKIHPHAVRERKGSYFTPKIWVELSQRYIADVLGDNWQDEYFVWDCAAGTGNLLNGLTNKYNIWASTLDRQDVDVMHDRIKNGANLLESHVFQFDFLNDGFSTLPQGLQDIISDGDKRKKLLVYINPPYAEADNRKGEGRKEVAVSEIHKKYSDQMGYTKRELYIQFLTRIYFEICGCRLAVFSTLKNLQAPRFLAFRKFFRAKIENFFLMPANSFDNVKGDFPIGFYIWNTSIKEDFEHVSADVYNKNENAEAVFIKTKNVWAYDNVLFINDWVKTFRYSKQKSVATIIGVGNDFQNQRLVRFGEPYMKVPADNHNWQITQNNLIESCIYFAVRKVIPADWLNDRDQFLYPNDGWENDFEFQNDCLAYTLFSNNIRSKHDANHWIPFTEYQVGAQNQFDSGFMTDCIAGKIFSPAAKAVFKAGKALWKYYHSQKNINVNASLYDIRAYFQGRNEKGTMNNASADEHYNELIGVLRRELKILAKKIEPKVYAFGFLKG
jgi:hypothetical protein